MVVKTNTEKGTKSEPPEPPFEYTVWKWRRRFHVSYNEAMKTPLNVLKQDLEMQDLTDDFQASSPKK